MASRIVNFLLYQFGWFSCVLGAAWGYPLPGAFFALLLTGVHLLLAEARSVELRLMLSACLLGVLVDSAQQAFGVFTFKSDPGWPLWLPLWIFVIWAQFATLLHFALHWLSGRYLLGAIFGFVGGPLAYWSGIRLGAAEMGENPLLSIISLALVWASVTPLLLFLSRRTDAREGRYRWFRSRA
jgi:hypothetical protein